MDKDAIIIVVLCVLVILLILVLLAIRGTTKNLIPAAFLVIAVVSFALSIGATLRNNDTVAISLYYAIGGLLLVCIITFFYMTYKQYIVPVIIVALFILGLVAYRTAQHTSTNDIGYLNVCVISLALASPFCSSSSEEKGALQ